MTCIYCGGNHESDFCHGYNSHSMTKSLSDISSGIDNLSQLNEDSLEEISERYSEMIDAQERISEEIYNSGKTIAESNERITDEISQAGLNISENISKSSTNISNAINDSSLLNVKGQYKISESIDNAGRNSMIGSIISGAMISSALVGIGAILKYREQMEALRHKEKMSFNEETSDAGKARRELTTAASILFAGNINQAEIHLKNSLSLFPSSAETFRLRSIIESKKELHNEAIISLKTALNLSKERNLFPSINNINGYITDEFYEKVVTSTLSQISQEFAFTKQLPQAIHYLSDGIEQFPNNPDLQFQRIRILSKTNLWEKHFEEFISLLVKISPKHFNILYTDLQLRKKKKEIQQHLTKINKDSQKQLQNKKQALMMLSEGKAKQLSAFLDNPKIESFSFTELIKLTDTLTAEIKKRTSKNRNV